MKTAWAVGYIRVSTEEQAVEGVSLAAQRERIEAYGAAGLRLAAIVSDEASGAKPVAQRPGGQRVLQLLQSKQAGQVVALKLDRLFRPAVDALQQTRAWDRAGVALHLIDMGGQAVNTASAMGRMVLTMMAGFAELERNLIAERTSTALQHKKARGEAYSPTPLGFTREGDKLVADAGELRIVSQARRWRSRGWSYGRIAAELTKRGAQTKRGGWYACTVRYLLMNPLYAHKRSAA